MTRVTPSWFDTRVLLSEIAVNCLSPMNVSKRFLKLFKVGADTMNSGNDLGRILNDKLFDLIVAIIITFLNSYHIFYSYRLVGCS